MWLLGNVALPDGLSAVSRSPPGSSCMPFPHPWPLLRPLTMVDLSPRPSHMLGPSTSLSPSSRSWPHPFQRYVGPRGPGRLTAGSLKALTWGQVQLVQCFELLCEVSMVHSTCRLKPGRGACLARRPQGHISGCVPTPFLRVLVETPQSGTAWVLPSQVSRRAQTSPGPPASLGPYGKA